MIWSKATDAAAARASEAAIGAGCSRMSTTTISLPRPFIFRKARLASAFMAGSVAALIWPKPGDLRVGLARTRGESIAADARRYNAFLTSQADAGMLDGLPRG